MDTRAGGGGRHAGYGDGAGGRRGSRSPCRRRWCGSRSSCGRCWRSSGSSRGGRRCSTRSPRGERSKWGEWRERGTGRNPTQRPGQKYVSDCFPIDGCRWSPCYLTRALTSRRLPQRCRQECRQEHDDLLYGRPAWSSTWIAPEAGMDSRSEDIAWLSDFLQYYWWEAGAMWGQLINYWNLTGDTQFNDVTKQALLFQISETKNYMPQNQSKNLVSPTPGRPLPFSSAPG